MQAEGSSRAAPLTPPRPKNRRFGTVLSVNSPPPPDSSAKKIKVRRNAPISLRRSKPIAEGRQEYTVVFEAGPIGLQLEPFERNKCRVQRFVDGGPNKPGPARQTGKIQPGDWVLAINGIAVHSYDATIKMLKNSNARREITFCSAWNDFQKKEESAKKTPDRKLPGTVRKTPSFASSSAEIDMGSPDYEHIKLESQKRSNDEKQEAVECDDSTKHDASAEASEVPSARDTSRLRQVQIDFESPSQNTVSKPIDESQDESEGTTNTTVLSVTNKTTTGFSPSRVKQLSLTDSAIEAMAKKQAQSKTSTVLKTVYSSVAAPAAGAVASGSYKLGSILSTKLGEALVGHSGKEFDNTVELKSQLLKELSQAKMTLAAQQTTIETLKNQNESERTRLKQELDLVRQEKDRVERSLESIKEQLAQLKTENAALRHSGQNDSIAVLNNERRVAELESSLKESQLVRTSLEEQVQQLEIRMQLHNQELQEQEESHRSLLRESYNERARLQQELDSVRRERDRLDQSKEAMQAQLAGMESKIEFLRRTDYKSKNEGQQNAADLAASLHESQKARLSLENHVRKLEERLQLHEHDRKRIESLSGEKENLRQQVEQLKGELERTKNQFRPSYYSDSSVVHLSEHSDDLKTAERTIGNLRQSLSQRDANLNELKKEKDSLASELARIKPLLDKTIDEKLSLLQRLNRAQDKIAEITMSGNVDKGSSNQRSAEELSRVKAELKSKGDALTSALVSIDDLRREKEELASRAQELRSVARDASHEESRLRLELEQAKTELFEAKSAKRTLQGKLNQHVDAEKGLQKKEYEVAALISKLNSAKSDAEEVSSEFKKVKVELEAARSRIDELEDEKVELSRREQKLRAQIEEDAKIKLQGATTMAEIRLSENRREIADLQRQVQSLESARMVSVREAESLHKANEELLAKVKFLQDNVDTKEDQLATKSRALSECTSTLHDIRADLRQRDEELEQSRQAVARVQEQYSQLSDRLSHVAEDSTREKDSFATDLIDIQNELAQEKHRSSELDRLLRSMRRNVSEAEARASDAREQLNKERKTWKDAEKSLEQSKRRLEQRVELLTEEAEKYRRMGKAFQTERDRLQSEVDTLQKGLNELKRQHNVSVNAIDKTESSFAQERNELIQKLSEERRRATSLGERLRSAKIESEEIQSEFDLVRRRLEEQIRFYRFDSEAKSKRQAELLESKEKELKGLRHSMEELKKTQSDVSRLEDSLRRSRDEVKRLTALLEEIQESNTSKLKELSKAHLIEVQHLTKEKSNLEASLRKSEERQQSQQDRLFLAEKSLVESRSEEQRLLTERDRMSAELLQAEDSISELRSELKEIQNNSSLSLEDDEDESFAGLSKAELKSKCRSLQEAIQEADQRALVAKTDVSRRIQHIKCLEEDLELMSSEIDKLVETNGFLEERLDTIRSDKASSDATAASLQARVVKHEDTSKSLKAQLDDQLTRNESLNATVESLQSEIEKAKQEYLAREDSMDREMKRLDKMLSQVENEKEEAVNAIAQKSQEISALAKQKDDASNCVSQLEEKLSTLNQELIEAKQDCELYRKRSDKNAEDYTKLVESLEGDCVSLRAKVSELEVEVENQRLELEGKRQNERTLCANLEGLKKETADKESMREEAVSKLAETSRVVAVQKESINALELRASDAERSAASLAAQVERLQESIKNMEAVSEANGDHRLKQLQEMESRCAKLDEEFNAARSEASGLRDELRQARRQSADYEKMNETLLSRIEDLKGGLEQTKAQLCEARSVREESTASTQTLENELEGKKMEVDHLKTKVQVLNATVARMKSDYRMLQEAALQAEFKNAASKDKSQQISRLKSELHTKASKLDSLSDAYRSQQQALALSQTLEEQLLGFVGEIISKADDAFEKISCHSMHLEKLGDRIALRDDLDALDLAGVGQSNFVVEELRTHLDELSRTIPKALSDLEEKRSQLQEWKVQRKLRGPTSVQTPDSKSKPATESPSVVDAFQKMKRLLNEEVLSPNKVRKTDAGRLDAEYLQKVIHSLESQIDALLADLKSANDALKAKDQLFGDLEQLVTHHEMERDELEKKLESMNTLVREMEERLNREVSWKEAAEAELVKVKEGLTPADLVTASKEDRSLARKTAGRLIVNFIESQAATAKASAFREWACQTSALRAVSEQGQAAAALTQQLETTREKLAILKRHLKKNSRRGREPALDSILEGYETT